MLPAGTARLPRMSAGGWPWPTIDFMAVVAGVSRTPMPPAMVTELTALSGELPVIRPEPTVPRTTMNTAIPRTMRAGRADIG